MFPNVFWYGGYVLDVPPTLGGYILGVSPTFVELNFLGGAGGGP